VARLGCFKGKDDWKGRHLPCHWNFNPYWLFRLVFDYRLGKQGHAMKTQEMERQLDILSMDMFGTSRTDSFRKCLCVMCKGPAVEFKDSLSRKEYGISGMCQKCQDAFFTEQ
jgi:hypothetical protein